MSTKRRHLGLGSNPTPPPPALFSVLLPFQWSSGKILPATIDVKALVSVQQFCWVSEGDVYGSLIYKMVVWLAQSKIRVSSQRGWWCLDHACSVIADISVSPLRGCLVLLQMRLQCPLCFPDVLLPTTAGDLVNHSRCFQCMSLSLILLSSHLRVDGALKTVLILSFLQTLLQ